jgi:hypothetical protein
VADAAGSVYVSISTGSSAVTDAATGGSLLTSFDGATGAMRWSTTFASAFGLSSAPLLLASDVMAYFAGDTSGAGAVLFDRMSVATGAVTSSTFVPGLAVLNPAVGSDGAFYFLTTALAVARLDQDANVPWLTSLVPTGGGGGSTIALAGGDLVLVSTVPSAGASTLFALDPTTGATRWTQTWPGLVLSAPVVRPDGSIAILVGPTVGAGVGRGVPQSVVVLEPAGATRSTVYLGTPGITGYDISAVGEDGSLLIAATDQARQGYLVSLSGSGRIGWTTKMPPGFTGQATIDALGTVIVVGQDEIEGLDPATGSSLWTVAAVNASGIVDATLTSAGTIVALETDGTLFGAGD